MKLRYLGADNLMCLLLPKRATLLPWRRQPKVMFAYTFNEWLTFASQQKGGQFMEYRKILQLPVEQQLQYFYADACMSQYYEIAFSGERATNIIATQAICSEEKVHDLLTQYDLKGIDNISKIVGAASPYREAVTLPKALSSLCLVYCYEMSLKGDANVWKVR